MTKAVLSGWLGLMAAFAVLFAPALGFASSPGFETEPTLDVRIAASPILAHGASSSTELNVHVAVASGSGGALNSVVASGWVLLHDLSEPGARTVHSTHVTTPVDLRIKARAGRRYQVEFMPDEPASPFIRHTTTTEMPGAKPAAPSGGMFDDLIPKKPKDGQMKSGFKRSFEEGPGMLAGVGAFAADVVGAD